MLILSRKVMQSVSIDLGNVDPNTPVGELFKNGPIEISVVFLKEHQVRLGFVADPRFHILRSELAEMIRKHGRYSTG